MSSFEARILRKEVQRLLQPEGVLVGMRNIYKNMAALLMEITSWDVTKHIQPLCEDIVALSPKWAIVRTVVKAERWSEILTDLMRNDPYSCILRLQWRQSYHGGRPWALPAAISQQVQAVCVQAKERLSGRCASAAASQESTISINGNLGPNPVELIRHMLNSIQAKLGFPLREVPDVDHMSVGDWAIHFLPSSQVPSGKVKVVLANSLSARELKKAAHNQSVTVGGEAVAVQVSNVMMTPLPGSEGNRWEALAVLQGSPPGL